MEQEWSGRKEEAPHWLKTALMASTYCVGTFAVVDDVGEGTTVVVEVSVFDIFCGRRKPPIFLGSSVEFQFDELISPVVLEVCFMNHNTPESSLCNAKPLELSLLFQKTISGDNTHKTVHCGMPCR